MTFDVYNFHITWLQNSYYMDHERRLFAHKVKNEHNCLTIIHSTHLVLYSTQYYANSLNCSLTNTSNLQSWHRTRVCVTNQSKGRKASIPTKHQQRLISFHSLLEPVLMKLVYVVFDWNENLPHFGRSCCIVACKLRGHLSSLLKLSPA